MCYILECCDCNSIPVPDSTMNNFTMYNVHEELLTFLLESEIFCEVSALMVPPEMVHYMM